MTDEREEPKELELLGHGIIMDGNGVRLVMCHRGESFEISLSRKQLEYLIEEMGR